jgi:hypothetical protein
MRYLLLLLLIGCATPTEPVPLASEFSLSSASAMIYDIPGGKGILFSAWVTRIGDGENEPEVEFSIYMDSNLLESVFAYPEIAHKDSSIGFAAKSTVRPYTTEELELITIDATVSSMEVL